MTARTAPRTWILEVNIQGAWFPLGGKFSSSALAIAHGQRRAQNAVMRVRHLPTDVTVDVPNRDATIKA